MEFVTVKYPESKKVFIDGEEAGFTNTTLRVGGGTHTFSLGEPKNYKPDSITLQVTGTTSVKPMEVTFEKI
ncbi:MAG: PEGA domain-containing protein [Desulfobacterales bacterium]|jgi:hypothetical protein|nr:PEGA domain-containing protein [Desulfobacterales bacterium]